MTIDNVVDLVEKLAYKKLDWRQAETDLHITSSSELATVLAHSDNVDPAYEAKERHIVPNSIYSEDADMHANNNKPLTKQDIIKRIQKSFHLNAEPISKKSFHNIKLVAKILNKETKKDEEAYELDNLPDEEEIENELPDQETLGEFINEHCRDLLVAGNLDVYYDDSGELAFTSDENIPNDECLDINELSSRVNRLVKLGRKGITRLEDRDTRLARKIMKLQDTMNTIA